MNQRPPGYEPDELTRLLYSAIYPTLLSGTLSYHILYSLSRVYSNFYFQAPINRSVSNLCQGFIG